MSPRALTWTAAILVTLAVASAIVVPAWVSPYQRGPFRIVHVEDGREVVLHAESYARRGGAVELVGVTRNGRHYDGAVILSGRVYRSRLVD